MHTPDVIFEDQSLRDGLQMESRIFSIQEKIRLVDLLADAGLKRIQIGSFVHPKLVPQMADTDELARRLGKRENVSFSGLILNARGLERALACGMENLAMSVSVSDTHSRKNANRPAAEALESMAGLISEAVSAGLSVRAGLQCAFGCVYKGFVDPERVKDAALRFADAGAKEINLADTTGMAIPETVASLCQKVKTALPDREIVLHLHDTRGMGMANLLAGYKAGVRIFDVCAGGLGGCPFVKGAAGNVAAEDAAYALSAMGVNTGVDLEKMALVVGEFEKLLGRQLPGRMAKVVRFTNKAGLPGVFSPFQSA